MTDKIFIIKDNNKNILGLYDKKSLAFAELMDIIINQFNLILQISYQLDYNDLLKLSNNFRIISMKINTNMVFKEYFFSLQTFSFLDNTKNIEDFFDEYNYSIINKQSQIKDLYHKIADKCKDMQSDINVFIPTGILGSEALLKNNLDTEYVNNNLINSANEKNNLKTEIDKNKIETEKKKNRR